MSQREKLFESICANPSDVRFDQACKAAEALGFVNKKRKGSHKPYGRENELIQLNFQRNKNGKIPLYQAQQLIAMIEKYGRTESDTLSD